MFFKKDEIEIKKLVLFYSIYTTVYVPLLVMILFWTDWIYWAGKYKFNLVIFFIVFAEIFKCFSSVFYLKTHDVNLSKKYDDMIASSLIKNVLNKAKIKEGFKNIIVISFMIVVYSIVAILYGAEVFSKYEETVMFSSLLSVLTVLPVCMNLGSQSVVALFLGSKPINKLEIFLHQNFCLTVFGAWLGAFVIPLDWDRPWQVWPIPCSIGAMIGFALSNFLMIFKIGYDKRRGRKILQIW